MNVDYSKLTNKSREAISKAYALTKSCCYGAVEPQVFMVAIFQEGNDMVPFLLNHMRVDKTSFLSAVSDTMRSIPHQQNSQPPLSPALDRVIAKAIELAAADHISIVGLEYLFLAFIYVDGPVRQVMQQKGVTPEKLRRAVKAFQRGEDADPSTEGEDNDNRFETLRQYGVNMIKLAREGSIEPVIGRDEEIHRILQIISRKTKNNPVLVGEPGTGKTAIAEGLAHRIIQGDIPPELRKIKLYSLDLAALIAGAQMQGEFEKRLKKVIEEAESDPNIILFIDEIHLIMGAGRSSGAMDAANILKPALARGSIKVIGATTLDEYRKHIEKDKAFERRFQKVMVEEPDVDSAISIMRGIKSRFETHHHIKILDDAIVAAVRLSHRYISDRFLPDKAIDLLDEAASAMRLSQATQPHDLEMLKRQIRTKEIEKESLIQDGTSSNGTAIAELEVEIANMRERESVLNAKWQNERRALEEIQEKTVQLEQLRANIEMATRQERFREVPSLQRQEAELEETIARLTSELDNEEAALLKSALDEKDIMKVVTAWTGIPMSNLTEDENERLLRIEEKLHETVIGQNMAIKAVSDAIRRSRMGLGDPGKPIGTFLFLGTTGVGKTELCKALAEYLFNSREMMVRIDMSEYQQEHSVARLFGAPPGYVGYDEGGQLTEAVRRRPYSVVLFDEIEKAHSKVFETLLQILDEGRMTDGQGRVVDFKNTIIIMTSNMGQEIILNSLVGPNISQELVDMTSENVLMRLKQRVAPEFINRIDDIVMFLPLGMEDIKKIVQVQLKSWKKKLLVNGIQVEYEPSAIEFLARKGYKPEYGGRPVKRAIQEHLIDNLSMALLRQEVNKATPIVVSAHGEEIQLSNQQASENRGGEIRLSDIQAEENDDRRNDVNQAFRL